MLEFRFVTQAALAAMAFVVLVSAPARAQKIPDPVAQEVLVKVSLLTLNDANVTGNYDVFHAKLSKAFRDQHTPAEIKEVFKIFASQKVDYDLIAAKRPISTEAPKIDDSGILSLKGYFDTLPSHLHYSLNFVVSDGEWKLLNLGVHTKKPD